MSRGLVVMSALLLAMVRVSAHEVQSVGGSAPGAFSAWDITAIAALIVSGLFYVRGTLVRARRGATQRIREIAAFGCGWSVLLLAMLPPIDALAIEQFAAHMLQHELMTLVAAPLIVAGRPLATMLWGLPPSLRGAVGRGLSAKKGGRVIVAASAPVVAWVVHGVVLWVWHAPRLYDAAVADEAVHAVQHAMFVVSAALFWWGMLAGRYGRVGYGAAVFYVFTTVVHTGLLGAILTLSPVPLYPTYVAAARLHGFDALVDQQLAGLLMWIPAGALLTILGLSLAAAWLGEAERRQRL